MRRFVHMFFCLCLLFGITACASKKTETDKKEEESSICEEGKKQAEKMIQLLKKGGIDIDYYINYDAEDDVNDHVEYIAKLDFNDASLHPYEKDQPFSGSIEIFDTNKEAIERADYIKGLATFDDYGNQIILEHVLLRLNKDYDKEQVDAYAKILNVEVYNYRDGKKSVSSEDIKQKEEVRKETETNENTTTQSKNTETSQKASSTPSTSETKTNNTATTAQSNALRRANNYLSTMPFSYEGLVNQLLYEGFSDADARYGVDHCNANWNEQALKKAKSYLRITGYSYSGLIHQLEFEKYTTAQATYAVDHCQADWNEQAAKKAQSYMRIFAYSRDGLIQQLLFEGFTQEQSEYGASSVGL